MFTKILSLKCFSSLFVALLLICSSYQIKINKTKLQTSASTQQGSWMAYLNGYLVNYANIYFNISSGSAIIDANGGTVLAQSYGFSLSKYTTEVETETGKTEVIQLNEYSNLRNAFDNNGVAKMKGGIRLNNEKYYIVFFYPERNVMSLKCNGGGATIAKTNNTFVIATYKDAKKLTVRTQTTTYQQQQNSGIINLAVESLQKFLLDNKL